MELGHQRKRVVRISTGSKQLDGILGGQVHYSLGYKLSSLQRDSGFQSMSISEVRSVPTLQSLQAYSWILLGIWGVQYVKEPLE